MSELPGLGVGSERLRVMCLGFHRMLTQHGSACRPGDPSQLLGFGFCPGGVISLLYLCYDFL